MNGSAVAKRYADGFLEYAGPIMGFDKGLEQLLSVNKVFNGNPELVEFLESPEITFSEKCGMVDKVFAQYFSEELRNFLKLLLKKERIDKLRQIADYARIKYLHGEKTPMLLETTYPVDTPMIEEIIGRLEKKLKKPLFPYIELNPALLGGIRVTIGNFIIDGSIRRRIEDMKDKLMTAKVA